MKIFNAAQAVQKLVGPIHPVGETNTDELRLENLKEYCAVIQDLMSELHRVASCHDNFQGSVARAGKYARQQLQSLHEEMRVS